MNNIYAIAKRELLAIYTSAIAWVFLTSFLLFNGMLFCTLVTLSSRPGAGNATEALSSYLGNNIFYWLFILVMIPLITMRLIAEEKRAGTIETMLTAPVNDWELVLGKFAAALGFYLSLWLPSVLYVAIMSAYGDVDWGPVGASFLGIILTGGALLALGVFTSSMTQNQIVAAFLCFILLIFVFSLGAVLEAVFPGEGAQQSVFKYINIWTHTEDFGKGIVDSRPITYNLSLLIAGLFGAAHVLGWRHRNAANRIVHYAVNLSILVVGVIALLIMANYFSARHYQRFDWTADNYYSLSQQTENVVKGLTRPVTVVVVSSTQSRSFGDVRELLERYGSLSTNLSIEYLDPYRNRARAEQLVQQYRLTNTDQGTIIFACGDQTRFVPETDLYEVDYSGMAMGQQEPEMKNFRGEEKFTSALLEVSQPGQPLVCIVTGHGEPSPTALRAQLARDNFAVEDVSLLTAGKVPDSCTVLAVLAPKTTFAAAELTAIRAYLDRGGHTLLALDPQVQPDGTIMPTGLEALIAGYGVVANADIVIERDPSRQLQNGGDGVVLSSDYGDHLITAPLAGIPSLFFFAQSFTRSDTLPPGTKITTLLSSSPSSWGERGYSTRAASRKDATDLVGPCALAVAVANDSTGMQTIIIGDGDVFANADLFASGANPQLARNCFNFLAARTGLVSIPPRNARTVKLTLTDQQVNNFFWVTVVLIPLATLIGGIYVWLRRRF